MTLEDIRKLCEKQVDTIDYITISPQHFKEIRDDCGGAATATAIHFLYQDNNRDFQEARIDYSPFSSTDKILYHKTSGGYGFWTWGIDTEETSTCNHKYVNVGFNSLLMVCKYCDKEQT